MVFPLLYRFIETPLGRMVAIGDDTGLCALEFCDLGGMDRIERQLRRADEHRQPLPGDHAHLETIATELAEYFSGNRQTFSAPLCPHGTEFQRRAWMYLRTIPFAQTRSYGQQARAVGDGRALRAVGRANGANPLAIVVPCHRVIGAGGDLTGYAGGLNRKRWLIEHERNVADGSLFSPTTTACGRVPA